MLADFAVGASVCVHNWFCWAASTILRVHLCSVLFIVVQAVEFLGRVVGEQQKFVPQEVQMRYKSVPKSVKMH